MASYILRNYDHKSEYLMFTISGLFLMIAVITLLFMRPNPKDLDIIIDVDE